MTKRRVVVTGLGAITPLGLSVKSTWNAAIAGTSGVDYIKRFDVSAYSSRIAAEVKDFNPENYFDVKELKKVDVFTQYAIAAAEEALAHAGLKADMTDATRCGSILGVGIGGLYVLERYHEALLNGGPRKVSPFLIPAMISNLAPGNIGIRFGLRGINYTIQSACTSSTHAIGESYRMIADGIQDVMVTGGAESAVSPIGMGGFCAMKALSTRNDEPQRASRPFDKDRDGFVMGEGGVILVLESLDHAMKRNTPIYAEIVGYGTSCDAYHITSPSPDGDGAVRCMSSALQDAGLKPADVHYINAHGTSTQANDISETNAIKKVFGEAAHGGLLVSSTKSMTGHLLGAAGAVEALFCTLAITEGIVPPTINLDDPSEGCDLDYVPHTAREKLVDIVMSNSFGFGGTNASIVLSRFR
jgi:3-oxoacyl-[acyl-carrier-protein] synthase II